MRLLVGGENDCSSSKMPNKDFSYLVTPSMFGSLVLHVHKSYFVYLFLITFLLAIMLQHIKIRIKIGALLDMWRCKAVFS